ncbi:MAG: CARDB domain-containing protein [Nanoarchaeota archaeon]|nr:CARDB domain-containing protein [Nanoarchaeota archaeon]
MVLLLIVACAPKVSDDQLEKDLSTLSPEEQSALLKQSQSDNAAAGNAIASRYGASDRTQLVRVLSKMRARATQPKPTQPVELKQPDLVVKSAEVSYTNTTTNSTGTYVVIKATIANVGTNTTGSGFSTSVITLPAALNYTSYGWYDAILEAGKEETKNVWYKCSEKDKVDSVNVIADYGNNIKESNEQNNDKQLQVTC